MKVAENIGMVKIRKSCCCKSNSNNLSTISDIVHYPLPFKDTTVENGKTYYYVVSSVDTSGNESGFSTETAATRLDLLVKTYSSLTGATAVAVGDVNGDGKPDLILGFSNGYSGGSGKSATYGGNVVIFYGGNTTDIPDVTLYAPAGGGFGYSLAVVDMNHDGYDTVTVTVVNKNQIDSLLKAKWGGMKTALVGGNAEGAVSYFAERSKESFRQQFNALSQILPQVAADTGVVTMVNVKDNVSEYDLRTVRNGTTYSFQLVFEKDINCIWRIRRF